MSNMDKDRDELGDKQIENYLKEDASSVNGDISGGEARSENKMGTLPVKRLIISMSLPMMISMLVQALYNIVDSVFVAQIEERALTAVTLAFPVQNFMISVAAGTGVGINALLSKSLGEKRYDKANHAANAGLFVIVLSSLLFLLVGLFGARAIIGAQSSDELIISPVFAGHVRKAFAVDGAYVVQYVFTGDRSRHQYHT